MAVASVAAGQPAVAEGPAEPEEPEEPEGHGGATPRAKRGPLELWFFGGSGGPAGRVGVGAALSPVSRLTLGVALGQISRSEMAPYSEKSPERLRMAFLARGYVVDGPTIRLGLGVATSKGDQWLEVAGQSCVRSDARRIDGSGMVELFRGNVALRLELGMGRMLGDVNCDRVVAIVEPSPWRPYGQLALLVRPGGDRAAVSAAARAPSGEVTPGSPPPVGQALQITLAAASVRITDFRGDSGGDLNDLPFDAGIAVDYLRPTPHPSWRWGIGARYGFGTGTDEGTGRRQSEHIGYVPLLLGGAWRSGTTYEEVQILAGVGPALLMYGSGGGSSVATGIGVELTTSYVRPMTASTALVVGIGVRMLSVDRRGSDSYTGQGLHFELPVHLGLRFGL